VTKARRKAINDNSKNKVLVIRKKSAKKKKIKTKTKEPMRRFLLDRKHLTYTKINIAANIPTLIKKEYSVPKYRYLKK
jgi:hypothetical protein